jgi:hypothetical protein
MVSENPNRVPEQAIVSNPKIVLPEGHPDTIWFNPYAIITSKSNEVQYGRYLTASFGSPISVGTREAIENPSAVVAVEERDLPDVPNLTDIELFSSTKYYDPVTKVEKAKIVIKVTNTSKDKANIEGVDARIYNPSEKL